MALDDDGTENEDGPVSPSPKTRTSRLFGGGKSNNTKEGKDEEGNQDEDRATKNEHGIKSPSPKPRPSRLVGGGGKKDKEPNGDKVPQSPSASRPSATTKSPRRPMASLFRKAAPPLSDENEGGGGGEDINDVLESPKPRGSRRLPVTKDGPAIDLPMGNDFDSEEEKEVVTSRRAKRNGR